MKNTKLLVNKTILSIGLAFLMSGCTLISGMITPTPGFKEVVRIDPQISNRQLTEQLLVILSEHKITPCSSVPHLSKKTEDCFAEFWQGELTRVDRDLTIIEIGNFPKYSVSIIGHSARIKRSNKSLLEITVKGVHVYYSNLPNKDVALLLAKIIRENL